MNDPVFDSQILLFEQAWQRGQTPEIETYVHPLPAESRASLLRELVCIDLEYRWKQQSEKNPPPLRAEDYFARFPELAQSSDFQLVLRAEEYRVRHRFGDKPSRAEYLNRCENPPEALDELLRQVDREFETESESDSDFGAKDGVVVLGEFDREFDANAPLRYSDYTLKLLIGAGRMGKVYKARQQSLERDVAVKFLRKTFLGDPIAVRRFVQEAKTVARFQHPNIVAIHGLGRTPAGGYFLVMDWIDGSDLAAVIRESSPISVANAIHWTIEASRAIEEAHRHGIIHCDLKPANILLSAGNRIRVTDFGMSRSIHDESRTSEGIEGTARYMAPEQVSESWGPIGPQTDVYGLGAVLYALLTGSPPFDGRNLPDVLSQVVSDQPVPSPESHRSGLPDELTECCRRCLKKDLSSRLASVRDLREALETCLAAVSENR